MGRVLIIEQERIIAMDIQLQLKKTGYTVCLPISLVDTEVVIGQDMPDLIIADNHIQEQKEFERIKKHFISQKLPIIFIGEKKDIKIIEKELNIIGTFPKPFDSKDIIKLVDKYLKNNRQG